MLHSASPSARRRVEKLLTSDPFKIDIRLDDESKNRGVEIFNAYFRTIGLKLEFHKVFKNNKKIIGKKPITYFDKPKTRPIMYYQKGEKAPCPDIDFKGIRPIVRKPITYYNKR